MAWRASGQYIALALAAGTCTHVVMAKSYDSNDLVSTKLQEKDIPGASLNGRDPNSLKVPELKRWLICRGASTRGNKPDLISR